MQIFPQHIEENIEAWSRGKWWQARLVLWAGLAYLSTRYLWDPHYGSLFGGLNLGIHEAGHLFFQLFGNRFLAILGGTLFELGAPIAAGFMFYRQPDYFAISFCGVWFGISLMSVAVYCADARLMELPLVTTGGGEASHDWNNMLGMMGLLPFDSSFGLLFQLAAFITFLLSLIVGARIIQIMMGPVPAKITLE